MKYWKKLSKRETSLRIAKALKSNINFEEHSCLGIPASKLDDDLLGNSIVGKEPLLQVYLQNPNHIGCHTLGESEVFFNGTQALEKELIELLAVDLLGSETLSTDGYIAAGGTEANLQAMWIYRNYFLNRGARHEEIAIICSEDTHYSISKAANLLHLDMISIHVQQDSRKILPLHLEAEIERAVATGKKYFIAVSNMGTTMFGSVDDPGNYSSAFRKRNLPFFIHVDGAFGGFIYPVAEPGCNCNFSNPDISSITLDAHKMLQAPYGTGVFIVRKGLIQLVITKEAAYVNGLDLTVSGSRSGANAVAVWLLLFTYGPFGWLEKINKLLYRTDWLCQKLSGLKVQFFNQPGMNIVSIKADCIGQELANKYGLVPDHHSDEARWYKIVIMEHVNLDVLNEFLSDLEAYYRVQSCSCLVKEAV
ncbi:MAG TPA: pyridoxal-dependent decarboxylase [Flavisolibacter sp.]